MNCDPLTVGFLYAAFHSKDFHFCKKWTPLLRNCVNLTDQMKKPSNRRKKRTGLSLPDVKRKFVTRRISSSYLGNVDTTWNQFRGCNNCMIALLCSHLVVLLEKNRQQKCQNKTFFQIYLLYINRAS